MWQRVWLGEAWSFEARERGGQKAGTVPVPSAFRDSKSVFISLKFRKK